MSDSNLDKLPLVVLVYICSFLPLEYVLKFALTNKRVSKILESELLWKRLAEKNLMFNKPDHYESWKEFAKEGFFEWQINEDTSDFFKLQKRKRRVVLKKGTPRTVCARQLMKGEGKYHFLLRLKCNNGAGCSIGEKPNRLSSSFFESISPKTKSLGKEYQQQSSVTLDCSCATLNMEGEFVETVS